MTRAEIEKRLADHQEHFERRDVDALAADHEEHGTFASPAHGLVQGREAIRNVYRYWYGGFPDFLLRWEHPLIDGNRAAFFWSFDGTAQGPFFGVVRAGTPVVMAGAAEYVFGDHGILSARHVFDFSSVLVRTGILKIRPA